MWLIIFWSMFTFGVLTGTSGSVNVGLMGVALMCFAWPIGMHVAATQKPKRSSPVRTDYYTIPLKQVGWGWGYGKTRWYHEESQ